ncbi:MAG TPA: HAMP domain-containing sensor histidine kinase [Hyphomicrobiaceae bacterium]|nr:HAMP domain-containing sensor histidine kinase [Hyphomicrobiaceae bacterium]
MAIPAGAAEPAPDLTWIVEPAWLIDTELARVVAANPAGARALGGLLSPGAILDRAMPALHTLRQLSRRAAGEEAAPLLFWTASGAETFRCRCRATREPSLVLVVADPEIGGPRSAGTERIEPAPPAQGATAVAGPSEALRDRSLATVAHELRTPLAAIAALAEFLMDEKAAAMPGLRQLEYAADIHYTAHHALSVVDALLSGRNRRTSPGCDEADVGTAVAKCLSAVRGLAARAAIRLEAELSAGQIRLAMDPRVLTQILLNLLSNALKFTPSGGVIRVETRLAADGSLELSVSDTGTGMEQAEIERVSDAEPRLPAQGTTRGGGSGYGLVLVRALASANGAAMRIESSPGAGTRVLLLFGKDRLRPA